MRWDKREKGEKSAREEITEKRVRGERKGPGGWEEIREKGKKGEKLEEDKKDKEREEGEKGEKR